MNAYVVFGCARSGTTSLCRILDAATNGVCLSEPWPNLTRESRLMMEGRFDRAYQLITETVLRRAAPYLDQGSIYGEKNNTLGPFIPVLHDYGIRLVYVHRDGRDVVRSLMNWHNEMFGSIYRECSERGTLNQRAKAAVAALPLDDDHSDFSRPRPSENDAWFGRWDQLTRLEMCAWYWSRINELMLDQLERLPRDSWVRIDYTNTSADAIVQAVEILGLRGLSRNTVSEMLTSRINSLKDRTGTEGGFPNWRDWTPEDRAKFDAIAGAMMLRLGYYSSEAKQGSRA
jgi:hypothetical protein